MAGSKEDFINYRVSKSKEIFQDALLLANNQRWNSCVNRLYYSSYYLISSLLYQKEIKAETHNGVKTQFFLHFIKNGEIDKDYGKLFSQLFDWRQESDYVDFREFDKETVVPLIQKVKLLNEEILNLIQN